MVNIDTVYQKVLYISNKEQRGYITPQEFNLMADKAQLEIINNYIHELKMAHQKNKNTSEVSDPIEMLNRKISYVKDFFDTTVNAVNTTTYGLTSCSIQISQGPSDVYFITNIMADPTDNSTSNITREIIEFDEKQLANIALNPLTRPTVGRPVFVQPSSELANNTNTQNLNINIFPELDADTNCRVFYIKKPNTPNWGFVLVNEKALYNFNTSRNFILHPSEEENLVTRILQLSGVITEKPDLVQGAYTDEQVTTQKQNS